MNIWNVTNISLDEPGNVNINHGVRLWRTDPGIFRVILQGGYPPILDAPAYTLIQNKYVAVFKALPGQLSVHTAIINDFVKKTKNTEFTELIVFNKINPDTIFSTDATGQKLWVCSGSLFVTGEIKLLLQNIKNCELHFQPGFSCWGG
jgi:hypothetical protein